MDPNATRLDVGRTASRWADGKSKKAGKAMAQDAGKRPEFPNTDRKLYTPDENAQRQVVARIRQAMDGPQKRPNRRKRETVKQPQSSEDGRATYRIEVTRHLPMGEHPQISYQALGEQWGVGKTKARDMVHHPEDMDPWQVRQLCDLCGVTLEWLRGWEDVNAYGKHETAETVAAMYSHLSNEDRALVSSMLTRLLGADAVDAIRNEQWERDNREWLDRNPKKARKIQESLARLVASTTRETWEGIGIAAQVATAAQAYINRTVQDAARHARAIVDRYAPEEWELMRQTADRLKAQGVDADKMTPDELLAHARGDC